jgi:hypothetical protein
MSKKTRAIEIVKNLTRTISKLKKPDPFRMSDNEMFHISAVSKRQLQTRKKELIKKYNLNERDYTVTEEKD